MVRTLGVDLARQVQLLGLRLAALVPLFQDLAEARRVDLDKLLQLGEVFLKVAETFQERNEGGRVARDGHLVGQCFAGGRAAGRERNQVALLGDERRESRTQVRLLLQVERIDLLELALQLEEKGGLVDLQLGRRRLGRERRLVARRIP